MVETQNSTAFKRKPMGLKARAAKRQEVEKVTAGGVEEVNDFDDVKNATIMLKDNGTGESTDEVDLLESIYDGALEALEGNEIERAIVLLRGTVHEADRILRVNDESKDAKDLSLRFFYIYGMALFSLSELAEPEDSAEYLKLAIHRLEQARIALEAIEKRNDKEEFLYSRVFAGIGKVILTQAARFEDENSELSQAERCNIALKNLDKALDILRNKKDNKSILIKETSDLSDLALSLVESEHLSPELSQKLIVWTESKLETLANYDTKEANYALAHAKWIQAEVYLQKQDDETGHVPENEKVSKLLEASVELLKDAEDSDTLLLLGEIQINLGNLKEEEADQEALYKEAVSTFNKAKEQVILPDEFADFVKEFA